MDDAQRLQATEAIQQCKARYCYTVDAKDWPGFGEVFTPDAVWDISGCLIARHAETGEWNGVGSSFSLSELQYFSSMLPPICGRTAIADAAKEAMRGKSSFHKLFMPVIEITSTDRATAVWPAEDVVHSPDSETFKYLNGIGYYHETYERLGGRWLIKSSRVTRIFVTIR